MTKNEWSWGHGSASIVKVVGFLEVVCRPPSIQPRIKANERESAEQKREYCRSRPSLKDVDPVVSLFRFAFIPLTRGQIPNWPSAGAQHNLTGERRLERTGNQGVTNDAVGVSAPDF